jgi:hypothetical protein
MPTLSQFLKRSFLALVAVMVAITFTRTGYTQAPCNVGRGLDPLDVINSGVRHNVWIVLDSSGSMNSPFAGGGDCNPLTGVGPDCKINVARRVIKNLMERLVDGAGRPLVNWAFVHYDNARDGAGKCDRPDALDDLDTYVDEPDGCTGLRDTSFVPPSVCEGDSRADINAVLDGVVGSGITPIGVAFTDIAEYLVGQQRPFTGGTENTTNFVTALLAGQKNFIVHVTDGKDTCECEEGGYPPIFGDPVINPVSMRPNSVDPTVLQSINGPDDDLASYNAGLKGEVALKAIDPSLDESKGNIFVLGMDLTEDDKQKINTIAWMASGARLGRDPALMNGAFFADDEEGVVSSFEDILARVGVPTTTLSLGASSVASVKEVIATHTDTRLDPLEVMPLAGSDGANYRRAREIRADHRNNVLFATSVEVPGFRGHLTATNIYRVAGEGDPDTLNPRTDRVADFTELWDAGVELQDDHPDDRPMYFNQRGSTNLLEFTTNNVTPADLGVTAGYLSELDGTGAATANDARDIVVQVTRGYRLSVHPATGTIYDPNDDLNFSEFEADGTATWKLYENISGSVAVVSNPPRSPDFDPPLSHAEKYGVGGSAPGDGFYWDHINRRTVVYYPSNLGVMHGFDAQFGTELVAFIPDDTVGLAPEEVPGSRDTLKDVVALIVKENNGVINHKFTLAGAPTAHDAFLRNDFGGPDNWRSVLVFGRGRGGRFLTALDVTTVPTSPNTLGLLWNRGNREGVTEGQIDGLGETWSTPVMGNVRVDASPGPNDDDVDQWLVFAGGGYGCDNDDDEGHYLFAFRAEDGFIYNREQVTNDPNAAIPHNALPARPTLFVPHEEDVTDFKDYVTRVYIPDVQGNVWKLDTLGLDPADWTFGVFAQMGSDQPITAPVTILNDVFEPSRVYVMAGSGGDRRAPVPADGFGFTGWIDQDLDGANTFQYPAGIEPPVELPFVVIGERMFEQSVTIGQIGDALPPVVFFVASEENFNFELCTVAFRSTLYAIGVASGLAEFDLDTSTTGDVSTDLGEGKAFLFSRDRNVYVTRSGGLGVSADVSVWGDGSFDDEPPAGGYDGFAVAVQVEGFRISPF